MSQIADNILSVKEKIKNPTVKLIAVTKTVSLEKIKEAIENGLTVFGENRIQEATEKIELLKDFANLEWHMIGHLQTNKVKYIKPFNLIHSVDSLRLAGEINRFGKENNIKTNILIQVNIAKENTKFGFGVETLENLIKEIIRFENINVRGLMTITPLFSDPEESRPYYKKLRLIKEEFNLKELSMGMSHDFEIAIEEGATMVRVGSAIFGER